MGAALALDATGHLDRMTKQQQLLGYRGLAGIRVGDDCKGATLMYLSYQLCFSGVGHISEYCSEFYGERGLYADRAGLTPGNLSISASSSASPMASIAGTALRHSRTEVTVMPS